MKEKLISRIYAVILVLIAWTFLHFAVKSAVIPAPWTTFVEFIRLLQMNLAVHLLSSLARIITALGISLIAGTVIGLWIGLSKRADQLVSPLVYLLYPLPKIAFLPLLMILFGLGNSPKILLIVFIIIFQIIIAVRDGVREIPSALFQSVLSLGLNQTGLYRHLILPAIMPKLLTAMRISIGVSVSVLFFAENFATKWGIGYFIMNSWLLVDYTAMFSGILALSLLGLIMFSLIDMLDKKFCSWVNK